jgi:hypothetical protein
MMRLTRDVRRRDLTAQNRGRADAVGAEQARERGREREQRRLDDSFGLTLDQVRGRASHLERLEGAMEVRGRRPVITARWPRSERSVTSEYPR